MTQMYAALARVLRLGSLAACFVVVASFAMFAFDQVNGASQQQQSEIAGGYTTPTSTAPPRHSGLRRTIDNADSRIASPFDGVTSGFHSQWLINGVQTMLVLLVFGFGLGYVARFVRVRA
jgi:hypothetical protein